jgi:hypothetical protein
MGKKDTNTTASQSLFRDSWDFLPHHRPAVLNACLSNLFLIESQHVVTEAVVSSILFRMK